MTVVARGGTPPRPAFDRDIFAQAFSQSSQDFRQQQQAERSAGAFGNLMAGGEEGGSAMERLAGLSLQDRAALMMSNPELLAQLSSQEFQSLMQQEQIAAGDRRQERGIEAQQQGQQAQQDFAAGQADMDRDLRRELQQQQMAQEPAVVQALRAAGIDPRSPDGRGALLNAIGATAGDSVAKSDLIDEAGNVKSATSNRLYQLAGGMVGASIDPQSGLIAATAEQSRQAQKIALAAEQHIKSGVAQSINEGLLLATEQGGFPTQAELPEAPDPAFQVPPQMRERLLTRVADIARVKSLSRGILEQVPLGTGAGAVVSSILEGTVGQFLTEFTGREEAMFPDREKAAQAMRQLNKQLELVFANNPRFPVAEVNRILEMVPKPNALFTNPPAAVLQLEQLFKEMDTMAEIDQTLLRGGDPSQIGASPAAAEPTAAAEPAGDIGQMDLSGLQSLLNQGDDLTPEQLMEIDKRLTALGR